MSRMIRLVCEVVWFPVLITVMVLSSPGAGVVMTVVRVVLLVLAWLIAAVMFRHRVDPAWSARVDARRDEALLRRAERLAKRLPH